MPSRRVTFKNESGVSLAGIIDYRDSDDDPENGNEIDPEHPVAVFAHCFTCTKDLKAIVKISRALAGQGITVFRFDFTGLGGSDGSFAQSNFLTNLADLRAAVKWCSDELQPPRLLVGHSLGGAAAMASVMDMESIEAIVTLASPSCTGHLADVLDGLNPKIQTTGSGDVTIGGIKHTVDRQMIDVLRTYDLDSRLAAITKPHLIFHSPSDGTVKFSHAHKLLESGSGPKSFVTLNGSDHLFLNRRQDTRQVAEFIATWSRHWGVG